MEQVFWEKIPAAIWRNRQQRLRPVTNTDPVRFSDLLGVDRQIEAIKKNTGYFLAGEPANNALLWGSRGTGKSSIIKALLNEYKEQGLRVIEVDKTDLINLPDIVDLIRNEPFRFIIYCDDLSFDEGESTYKALKSVMEGSIELPPENVLIYATSNRRHLLPEYMEDNEQSRVVKTEIHHGEAVEEKISLSDRFGLWLSFYPINQQAYLSMVDALFPEVSEEQREALHQEAIRFALAKGGRSGRAARQFYNAYHKEF
ncbi:MAG: ATP-binding protein [Ketobacteraceae bacterium]|nr:ATP-binding protein [Ketobacteraceae bacterium]